MIRAVTHRPNSGLAFPFQCLRLAAWRLLAMLLLFSPDAGAAGNPYTGNLRNIIGDVKQGQITNALDTGEKIDHVLDGFEKLGCNGVRITIFPAGENPNPEMFDLFYQKARQRGFKVFANPAQHAGAQRLFHGDIEKTGGVKNNPQAAQGVIERVREFAGRYRCDWINPFNEDGNVGGPWSEAQINEVYKGLYRKVNGADLVGPCTWGIPAGIDVMQHTDVADYITVATTHNLGHNHDKWREFIRVAKRHKLPVWDSEVNTHKKFADRPHRLHAALEAGVDGLVLYHAWTSYVDRNTGELKPLGRKVRDLILKDPENYVRARDAAADERNAAGYQPQEGDILFQKIPRNPFVELVEGGAESPYSHCGLLVKTGGEWMVLEAMETVKETPVQEWRERGEGGVFDVYRLSDPLQAQVPGVIRKAREFLGRPYDDRYQMDDARLYGSELIYKGFRNATGAELGKLVELGDLVPESQKPIIMEVEGVDFLNTPVITTSQLAGAAALTRVYPSNADAR